MMKPEELQVSLLFFCSVRHFFLLLTNVLVQSVLGRHQWAPSPWLTERHGEGPTLIWAGARRSLGGGGGR